MSAAELVANPPAVVLVAAWRAMYGELPRHPAPAALLTSTAAACMGWHPWPRHALPVVYLAAATPDGPECEVALDAWGVTVFHAGRVWSLENATAAPEAVAATAWRAMAATTWTEEPLEDARVEQAAARADLARLDP